MEKKKKKKEIYDNFRWIEFKYLNSVEPFQGDSLLLTSKPLRVSGTLLIDLAMKPTMKPRSGFEPAKPDLLISLLLHSNKVVDKRFEI